MLTGDFTKSSYSNPSGNCLEARWTTSSYSAPGGNCVECRTTDFTKSSYSQTEIQACVETRVNPCVVDVRDSKDIEIPGFSVGADAWGAFLASVNTDEFTGAVA